MREDVQREMISADVVDPRGGGAQKATIAFAVGFESHSPELAARVANDLVTLYLQKNVETRTQLAAGTTEFLSEETEKLRMRIAEIEQRIADFKAAELRPPAGVRAVQRRRCWPAPSQEVRDVDSRIQALNQQIGFLDAQLAQIDPRMPAVTEQGQTIMGAGDRLRSMREQYVGRSRCTRPSIRAWSSLKREIYGLELQSGGGSGGHQPAGPHRADPRTARRGPLARVRPTRPSCSASSCRWANVVGQYKRPADPQRRAAADAAGADNPAYVSIQAQRQNAADRALGADGPARRAAGRIADLERRSSRRRRSSATTAPCSASCRASRPSTPKCARSCSRRSWPQNLESEQKGERFTLIEPPVQPQEPVSPNRPAILALGLLGALAAAVGLMVLLELLDTRVRGRRQVVSLVGVPPLAIIPWVARRGEAEPVRVLAAAARGAAAAGA